MKKIFKGVLAIVALLGVILGVLYVMNKEHVDAFPSIVPGFYAKEYCSCRFVVGQDDAFCHDTASLVLPVENVDVDVKTKTVTVTGPSLLLGRMSVATWVSERKGCVLQHSDPE